MNVLRILGRERPLFEADIQPLEKDIQAKVESARFLILGGAGTIGQSVVKEIFKRSPKKLHVVDLSENNLAELVRDLRSSVGYINGEFKTYALDVGSKEYDAFWASDGAYDYVLNLSALKHVRSEKDPFTLMRMMQVNVLNTLKTAHQAGQNKVKKYFCVSTDKATNPVNMMGASKRIMEMFLFSGIFSSRLPVSMARFANVAFSDGSLLHSFTKRLEKKQPIVAPCDVKRYFITKQEAGLLCLMSCLFGDNRDIFFPQIKEELQLSRFTEVSQRFLAEKNLEAVTYNSEDEARKAFSSLNHETHWPCYFTSSDTTGEKKVENFFTEKENINTERFSDIGVIKNKQVKETENYVVFLSTMEKLYKKGNWSKRDIINACKQLLPDFAHTELHKSLDDKM